MIIGTGVWTIAIMLIFIFFSGANRNKEKLDYKAYKQYKPCRDWNKSHDLKITSEYFDLQDRGIKNFEVRFNDRDYKVGDELYLNEFSEGVYTGRSIKRNIIYVFNDERYVKEGYVIIGTEKVIRED